MYEVTDLYLLKSYKETQTVMNIANKSLNTGQLDSFLPTAFYKQKMHSNQKVSGGNTMEKSEKNSEKVILGRIL